MYGGSAPYLTARMHVDSLTPDTVSAVVAAAKGVEVTVDRRVEADVRLVLFPLASDLDLDVLLRQVKQVYALGSAVLRLWPRLCM